MLKHVQNMKPINLLDDSIIKMIATFFILFQVRHHTRSSRKFNWINFQILITYSNKRMKYKWTIPWIDKLQYKVHRSWRNCELCNFSSSCNNSNSQLSDVVMGASLRSPFNIIPFTKTLRTVGCKAQIIIFFEESSYKQTSETDIYLLTFCKAHIVNVGGILTFSPKFIYAFKYLLTQEFLTVYGNMIDRALLIDLSDVVFQCDPFLVSMKSNKLYFCTEHFRIKDDKFWKPRIAKIVGNHSLELIKNKYTLNGGFVLGGVKPLLQYIEFFNSFYDPYYIASIEHDDQAYMNIIIYLNKTGIPIEIINHRDAYMIVSTTPTIFEMACKLGQFPKIQFNNITLHIVHQFDRFKCFSDGILKRCPNTRNTQNYMRQYF